MSLLPNLFHGRRRTIPGFVAAASTISALLGCTVLAGWASDSPTLRSVIPGAVEMKANTAVALIACGLSLALAIASAARARRVSDVLAVFVALLGAATLCEYAFGWQLGIDWLLVHDTDNDFSRGKARMSTYSAVTFASFGAAMMARSIRLPSWLIQALGAVVTAIGLLSILGYLWNAS